MRSIFLQYFKYGNVFIYLLEDGSIITLPVHLIRIANVMIGGEPVLEFNCKSVRDDMRQQGTKAQKDFLEDEDLKVRLEGFPPEVADALNKGADWVQLNPENTFVLQDVKEDWMRYAVPMVATCLNAFKRKALISQYESALLNLGAHSFVHVTYGDSKSDIMPDITALNAVNALFRRAMTGSALATTNHLCKATVIQPDTKEMFDDDKYRDVNAEILSAGGISGIRLEAALQLRQRTRRGRQQLRLRPGVHADGGHPHQAGAGQLLRADEQDQPAAQRRRQEGRHPQQAGQRAAVHLPACGSGREPEVPGGLPPTLGKGRCLYKDHAANPRV